MCLPVHPYKIEREWKHKGLSCAVVQAHQDMFRCGYVRVPPTHPLYGKTDGEADLEIHGGLTFAQVESCTEHEDGQGWWFGFDCGHLGDASFAPNSSFSHGEEHYWTQAEVEAECERLAEQLVEATDGR